MLRGADQGRRTDAGAIDALVEHIGTDLDKLAARLTAGKRGPVAAGSARVAGLRTRLRELSSLASGLEADLGLLIELRGEIDFLLDENIQLLTAESLRLSNEELALSSRLALGSLGIVVVVVAAGVLIVFAGFARFVLAPLRELAAYSVAIGGGRHGAEPPELRNDEIGALGATLVEMNRSLYAFRRQITAANEGLESTVEARTRDIADANRRLGEELALRKRAETDARDAAIEASAANRAKTAFLANMSHELRTPLKAVIGFAEVVKQELHGPLGHPAYRTYVEEIHSSGTHLLRLINDILDLSRIELGKLKLREDTLDLETLIADCRSLVAWRAEENGVALTTEVETGAPKFRGDETRIKQIVINLLDNSIKFTPAGGRVALRARTTSVGEPQVEIADTGVGIAPENLPTALSRFGQVDNGLDRKHQGAGLGLPLAKMLTEAHGGRFDIASEPSVGTTVTLTFPLARAVRPQLAPLTVAAGGTR
jgi:signal transduction histidine kinase